MLSHMSRLVGSIRLRILAGVTLLAMLGATGVLVASDPVPPAAPASKPVAISDVALARAVLTAIDADPVLKDVNIIVSVVDRGAVIGGPVLSDEIKKRAEVVVRSVPGIESVKNTCFVHAEPDPLLRAVAERMKPGAKPAGSTTLPGVALAPTAPDGFLPPVPPQAPSDLLAGNNNGNTVVVQKPPLAPTVGILGAPVAPGSGVKATPTPSPSPGSLTGTTTPAKPADVQAAASAIRKTNARFTKLVVEVKPDGGLFVTGSSAKAIDAWDFAAELRKLPGVTRVAVDPELVK